MGPASVPGPNIVPFVDVFAFFILDSIDRHVGGKDFDGTIYIQFILMDLSTVTDDVIVPLV